jgi:hypothetical protein
MMRPPLWSAALAIAASGAAPAPTPGVLPPIVFVSRNPAPRDTGGAASASPIIPGFGPHARALVTGGRLMIRDPDGRLRALLPPDSLFDVSDPAVSWDGRTVVFAGVGTRSSPWRLYQVGVDGGGLHALTFSDRQLAPRDAAGLPAQLVRYDDLDPCWIGPRRLVFASTRWPLLSEYGGVAATNVYALDLDDPRPRRLTTERNGAEEPAYDPASGRIVFSRWWHNRFRGSDLDSLGITTLAERAVRGDSANLWQLVSFDPARHDTRLAAGDPRSRVATMAYQPAVMPNGAIVAVSARHLGLSPSAGAVGLVIFGPAPGGAAAVPRGLPAALTAPRRIAGPALPTGPIDPYRDAQGLAAPQACAPAALPDGRIVFAFDPGARGDFGLYVVDASGGHLTPLADLPGTLELDPTPVVTRDWKEQRFDLDSAELAAAAPMRTRPADPAPGEPSFRFHCLNLFANAPPHSPIPAAPAPTPDLRIRFFAALSRPETEHGDTVVLLREAPVSSRGEVDVAGLPVDLPMFEQVVDASGRVLMSAHGPAHVAGFNASSPGERRCLGCHVGHSAIPVPRP